MLQKQIIAGCYQIGDQIGQGGMGEVYRGTVLQTGETVAIKVLHRSAIAASTKTIERFKHEGDALRQLNHPHIVKSLASVEENGQYYLVMEYVSGGSLAELLVKQHPLPIKRILEIALDVADALTRAHRLNIIHRDIKPANVLLADDGTPRLSDFGVAHLAEGTRVTETGAIIGTYSYLSPEACMAEPIDTRSDIWSFGVMLYEMVTGRLPFEASNPGAILLSIMQKPVPDVREYRPDTPPALIELIDKCLQKSRDERISSMRLVGARLEAILQGASTPVDDEQTAVLPKSRFSSSSTPGGNELLDALAELDPVLTVIDAPPAKRRTQFAFLVSILILVGLLSAAAVILSLKDDSTKSTIPKVEPVGPEEYMVLVAQPEPVGIDERPVAGAIVEDLTRILTTNVPFSPVRIREYPEIIGSSDEALKVAEANNAAVVIWGSYNADDVDLYIQVGDLSVFPYTTMERGVIERALNMSVRLQDPQQETIAPHVLWVMGTLLIIDGDAYHSMLVNAGLTQTFTHPAQVTDQSIATLDYHIRGDTHSDPQLELDGINQAIALDSVNPILYLIRGSIYQTMGEVDDARIDFETAQRLGPDSWAMPYIMLASIDNSNEAFALFDAVIERRPDDWFPQFMRAMLHYLNRRYDLAALEMQQVIALQPQANFPYVYEVMIDLRAGDLEAARAASHTILTEFPDPVLMSRMMVTSLGESAPNPYGIAIASFGYLVLGRYNDTITTAENGLESFLWYTDLNLMRGIAYCGLGRYEEAESAYTMAITMEEGIPLFHLMRGEVRLRQENTEGANADFAIATQNPAFVPLVEAMQSGALDCTTLLE